MRLFARFLSVKSLEELSELEREEPSTSDAANTLKTITADPEVARLAIERAEAEYYYELALRRERELGEAAGREEGKAEGEAEGRAEGEALGLARGKAETVLKLVVLKFGNSSEAIQNRVRSATVEELERLAEKVLFAASVDELFQD